MFERSSRGAPLKFWQWRIVSVGWITYASYYLGRVNLSIAIPDLRESLNLSSQEVGLFGSGFFLAYAFGQLISGHLGDRISPRKLVFGGMLLSVVMNVLFGAIDLWAAMLAVWTLNGLFQCNAWDRQPVLRYGAVLMKGTNFSGMICGASVMMRSSSSLQVGMSRISPML